VRKPAPKRAEKLDPFKAYIVDRVKAAAPDRIPAMVLFREIKARGYEGGETRVKQFVRGLVLAPAPAPVVRFEPNPVTRGRRTGQPWGAVRTSSRCSLRRWAGAERPRSSSATASASRR
jgi:transposase